MTTRLLNGGATQHFRDPGQGAGTPVRQVIHGEVFDVDDGLAAVLLAGDPLIVMAPDGAQVGRPPLPEAPDGSTYGRLRPFPDTGHPG